MLHEHDLHAYVDGALDADHRKEVQDYLDRHPDAAAAVAKLAAQRQLLRSALAPIADEIVPQRLDLAALARQTQRPQPWMWRIAASVFMALSIGAVGGWQIRGAMQPAGGIPALAGEARSSYAAYAMGSAPEIEMGPARRADFVQMVSAKLKQPIALPDLGASGYKYVGGRLVATEFGPAGLFLYDREDGSRIAMLVRPMARERDTPMMKHSGGAIGGYSWAARGVGYSIVGSERPDVLHPVANEVRRQLAGLL
jgi:anti-sigma factor RsiW